MPIRIIETEQIALLRGSVQKVNRAVGENFFAVIVPNGDKVCGAMGAEYSVGGVLNELVGQMRVRIKDDATALEPMFNPAGSSVEQVLQCGEKIVFCDTSISRLRNVSHMRLFLSFDDNIVSQILVVVKHYF
jgi:hypothetical protein